MCVCGCCLIRNASTATHICLWAHCSVLLLLRGTICSHTCIMIIIGWLGVVVRRGVCVCVSACVQACSCGCQFLLFNYLDSCVHPCLIYGAQFTSSHTYLNKHFYFAPTASTLTAPVTWSPCPVLAPSWLDWPHTPTRVLWHGPVGRPQTAGAWPTLAKHWTKGDDCITCFLQRNHNPTNPSLILIPLWVHRFFFCSCPFFFF